MRNILKGFHLPRVRRVSLFKVLNMWTIDMIVTISKNIIVRTEVKARNENILKRSLLGDDDRTPDTGNTPNTWARVKMGPIAQWKVSETCKINKSDVG